MKHHASERFLRLCEGLPQAVREQADKSFALLKADPQHPSLHFKNVGRFWSARVDVRFRALAVRDGEELIWFWIGDHDAYERLIRRR